MNWVLTFFVTALIAAVLGFTGVSGAASPVGKLLYFIFMVLTLVALIVDAYRYPQVTNPVGTLDAMATLMNKQLSKEEKLRAHDPRWFKFAVHARKIWAPLEYDEGDELWRVLGQSNCIYRGETLSKALQDFWDSEIRQRDVEGNPTEDEPPAIAVSTAHEPSAPALAGWVERNSGQFLDIQTRPTRRGEWVPLYFGATPTKG